MESGCTTVPRMTESEMEKFNNELRFWVIPIPVRLEVDALIVEKGNFVAEEQEEICFGHGHSHGEGEIIDIVYSDEVSINSADGDNAFQMKAWRAEEQKY